MKNWREAFFHQARSDLRIMDALPSDAERCHRLHYLQMATEKLARAWRADPNSAEPPPKTHIAFVHCLQQLKGMPWLRRRLGYDRPEVFRRFIDHLLDTARRVQELVPSEAGYDRPNPEYPWKDRGSSAVQAPCEYEFMEFDQRDVKLIQLDKLVRTLLRITA